MPGPDDAAKLHALEALLVGAMFFAAAGFVLTFDQPSSPNAGASDELQSRSEDTLDTVYDKPLDDPRYGDNTMSKRLAQGMSGNTDPLSDHFNSTLPRDTEANLYLNNGYATQPVHEQFNTSDRPTTSTTRLIQPEWSYVWSSTNLDKYPADPTTTATKMGLYTLPVSDGTVVDSGGTEVQVIVEGEQDSDQFKTSNFRLDTSFTVRQGGTGTSAIPHASLYFNDSNDDPDAYRNVIPDLGVENVTWYNLSLAETAGEPITSGSQVTISFPRGWTANATDEAGDYTVVKKKTDPDRPGELVFELSRDVSNEVMNLAFNTTYWGDEYEFYTYHASLDDPDFGDARLVVRAENHTAYTGGDFPYPRVSAPRSMGTWTNGTWTLSFPNPPNVVNANELKIDKITVKQPRGKDLFENANTLSSPNPGCGSPGWSVKSPSKMVWDPDPSNCKVVTHTGFEMAFEVRGNRSYTTELNLTAPFEPDAGFSNGHNRSVQEAFTAGFPREFVPPDTEGLSGVDSHPGYPHPSSGTETVDTDSVHETNLLMGETSYTTADIDSFQGALALGGIDAEPQTAIGETATIDIQLESLLLALSDSGRQASLETNIYPPWALGEKTPIHTVDHVEKSINDLAPNWIFTHDVSGDSVDDVIAITPQTKIYAFDGSDGTQLSGYQINLGKRTATSAIQYNINDTDTGWAIGFNDGRVKVLDSDFNWVWNATGVTQGAVEDLSAKSLWNMDDEYDIVAVSEGDIEWVNGKNGSHHGLASSTGGPSRVVSADLKSATMTTDHEVAVSLGKRAAVSAYGNRITTNDNTYLQDAGNTYEAKEMIEDQDTKKATKDPVVYNKGAALKGYDVDENEVWSGASSGFLHLAAGDLDDNGIDDVIAANSNLSIGGTDEDPGQIYAVNGTVNSSSMVGRKIIVGEIIRDIEAADSTMINTVSDDGILYYTKSDWATDRYWSPEAVDDPVASMAQFEWALDMDYINDTEGWMVGHGNEMYKTTDGNEEWTDVSYDLKKSGVTISLTDNTHRLENVEFLGSDGKDGVVVGGDCTEAKDACEWGFGAYTQDGGQTWHEASIPSSVSVLNATGVSVSNGFKYTDVDFPTESKGWAVGSDGRIAKTTDGGGNWSLQTVQPLDHLDAEKRPDLKAVAFVDENTGVAVGNGGTILNTSDGGSTWHNATMLTVGGRTVSRDLHDVAFGNDTKGWAVGENGAIYVTYDAGGRWIATVPPGPDDLAAGADYYTVDATGPYTGWAGGTVDGSDRLVTHLVNYKPSSSAESTKLTSINDWHSNNGDGLSKVRSATVDPYAYNADDTNITYKLSNDGCSTWKTVDKKDPSKKDFEGAASYEWVDFDDASQTDLCFQLDLSASDRGDAWYHSPVLENLTIEYEYKESGDSQWHTREQTFELDDAGVRDESATSARWNTTDGVISNPYVQTLWRQRVPGEVLGTKTIDLDAADGHTDVLAWTGQQTSGGSAGGSALDARVYAIDGESGMILGNTSSLPGKPGGVQLVDLPLQTNADLVTDFVVSYENETGDPKLRAYDVGKQAGNMDPIWTIDANGTAVAYATGDVDGDATTELVRGTDAAGGSQQPVIVSNQPDESSPTWEWTTRPDFLGKYTVNWDVPRHSLFGPYVVETSVTWDPAASAGTQSARLYDYFSVSTPSGEVPESPIYRLDLVTGYRGSR